MRKLLFILTLFLCIQVNAQNFHLLVYGGVSNYQGDLQPKRFTFDESHIAGGGGLEYELSNNFLIRAGVTFGTVSGDDKKSTNPLVIQRNLNFTSQITDVHLALEYDILDIYKTGFTPYIFAGIGYFHFNPYTVDSLGNQVYLQPLSTEGEGFVAGRSPYQLSQFNFPFGGGVKIALGDNVRLGIEVGLRKLFTDYLDDVSNNYVDQNLLLANRGPEAVSLAFRGDELNTGLHYPPANTIRGNPKVKDWYYFSLISLSFRLPSSSDKYNVGGKSKVGCPTRVY